MYPPRGYSSHRLGRITFCTAAGNTDSDIRPRLFVAAGRIVATCSVVGNDAERAGQAGDVNWNARPTGERRPAKNRPAGAGRQRRGLTTYFSDSARSLT